jgi:hypothetical protein
MHRYFSPTLDTHRAPRRRAPRFALLGLLLSALRR